MPNVTIYTDASLCPDTGAGGWAAWMRRGDEVRRIAASFRGRFDDVNEAELAAAANGIVAAHRFGLIHPGDRIVVVSDSMTVQRVLTDLTAARGHRRWGAYVRVVATQISATGAASLSCNHVKAHTRGKDPRSWVNGEVDGAARRYMQEARQRARCPIPTETAPDTPAVVAPANSV